MTKLPKDHDQRWSGVDQFLAARHLPSDQALHALMQDIAAQNEKSGLLPISVSPLHGQFLRMMVMQSRARQILEIGTLGAYSTLWMAHGLPKEAPDAHIDTIDVDPPHVVAARANIKKAGMENLITVHEGRAIGVLPYLAYKRAQQKQPPYDLIFIDADKVQQALYLDWALKLGRKGTLIISDNTLRNGDIANTIPAEGASLARRGLHDFYTMLEGLTIQGKVISTTLQMVGQQGYDGMTLATML